MECVYLTSDLETAAFQRVSVARVSINYFSSATYISQSVIVFVLDLRKDRRVMKTNSLVVVVFFSRHSS